MKLLTTAKILIIMAFLFATGCQEGVILPADPEQPLTKKIARNWQLAEAWEDTTNATAGLRDIWFFINPDGSLRYFSADNPGGLSGTWNLKDSVLSVQLGSEPDKIKMKLLELTDVSLVYEILDISPRQTLRFVASANNCLFAIEGEISNLPSSSLPPSTRISIAWQLRDNPGKWFLWGDGNVDMQRSRFSVNLREYPPTAALNRINDKNSGNFIGNVAVGRVIMHSNTYWTSGSIVDSSALMQYFMGTVDDRLIIMVSGLPQAYTAGDIVFPAHFEKGYALGRGKYNQPGGKDLIAPAQPGPIVLRYSNSWTVFKFPNWF
jgi:hypothetical protein